MLPLPISSHRDIQIFPNPTSERHMPSPPEINNGFCLVRGIEIDGKFQVQHKPQANCHLAVAREIKIQLVCISNSASPRFDYTNLSRPTEHVGYPRRNLICDINLFEQANDKQRQPERQISVIRNKIPQSRKLRHHSAVIDNRSSNQMWKNRHKQQIMKKRPPLSLPVSPR